MSDFATAAALIVATIELSVVRSIRSAVRANLIHAGGQPGPLGTILMPRPIPRERIVDREVPPAPAAEPLYIATKSVDVRHDLRPTCAPDAVRACCVTPGLIGDATRLANEPVRGVDPTAGVAAERPLGKRLTPLVPPWRLPLPTTDETVVHVVKYVAPRPDLNGKGAVIDVFI